MSLSQSFCFRARPRVGELDDALLVDHDVLGLDVAVDELGLGPRVMERLGDLLDDVQRLVDRDLALADEQVF